MGVLDAVWCALVKIINLVVEFVIDNVLGAIAWVIGLLPKLPVDAQPLDWGLFGDSIGYFLPIGTMAQHFVLFLGLMALWYAVETILRWTKTIK